MIEGPDFRVRAFEFGSVRYGAVVRRAGEFGSILRSERCRFGAEGNFRGGIELRRWRGAGSDPHSELEKKFLLSGWRTGAEHSHRLSGRVVKLMGRVRWDVNRFARVHDLLCASEDGLQFA